MHEFNLRIRRVHPGHQSGEDPANGENSGSTGWTNPEKILKRAKEDLLLKSEPAITAAPAIRQFAQKKEVTMK